MQRLDLSLPCFANLRYEDYRNSNFGQEKLFPDSGLQEFHYVSKPYKNVKTRYNALMWLQTASQIDILSLINVDEKIHDWISRVLERKPNLRQLKVGHSKLIDFNLESVFQSQINLELITLGNINFTNADQGLTILADYIRHSTQLRYLNLSTCVLTGKQMQMIQDALHENQSLVIFDMFSCAIKDNEREFEAENQIVNSSTMKVITIIDRQNNFSKLRVDTLSRALCALKLEGITLTSETTKRLAEAIGSHQNLRYLCLKRCKINPDFGLILGEGLMINQSLRHVDFSGFYEGESITRIIIALSLNLSVRFVNIVDILLTELGILSMIHLIKNNNTIKHLNCGYYKTNDDDAIRLSLLDALAYNQTLRVMEFYNYGSRSSNDLRINSVDFLRYNSSLQHLTIKLDLIDASSLASSLMYNHTLSVLKLQNVISFTEIAVIMRSLRHNQSLKYLEFFTCIVFVISDDAEDVFENLIWNQSLEVLVIGSFTLRDKDCKGVAQMLRQNQSLKELSIYCDRHSESIAESLRYNSTLTKLSMCCYGHVDNKIPLQILKYNQSLTSLIPLVLNDTDYEQIIKLLELNRKVTCLMTIAARAFVISHSKLPDKNLIPETMYLHLKEASKYKNPYHFLNTKDLVLQFYERW